MGGLRSDSSAVCRMHKHAQVCAMLDSSGAKIMVQRNPCLSVIVIVARSPRAAAAVCMDSSAVLCGRPEPGQAAESDSYLPASATLQRFARYASHCCTILTATVA